MFADKLKQILKDKKITCYKLAKMTGLSQTTVNRYASGQRQPTFENVDKIAHELQIPVSYFSDFTPNLYTILSQNLTKNEDKKWSIVPQSFFEERILNAFFDLFLGQKRG